MAAPMEVYVVDDDESVRDALSMLLDMHDIAHRSFASGDEFLAGDIAERRGCVLLDVHMPGTDGVAVQAALIERGSLLPVIFVTGHGDVPMAVDAMHRGAFDFLQKPYREGPLIDCIERAFAEFTAAERADSHRADIEARAAALTPREREVFERVVAGDANKVIAMDLGLSQRTVEVHRGRVMAKMQARSVAELVRMAAELGGRVE